MGDVEDLQYAEYQCHAESDDEQPRGLNQAIENNRQKEIHGGGVTQVVGGRKAARSLIARRLVVSADTNTA
jgi:hypothetical protein